MPSKGSIYRIDWDTGKKVVIGELMCNSDGEKSNGEPPAALTTEDIDAALAEIASVVEQLSISTADARVLLEELRGV